MRQFVRQFLFSLPVGIAFTDLVASVVRVDGASMQPTLNPEGSDSSDWVLVDKFSVKVMHKHRRGDVVILWCAAGGRRSSRAGPAARRRPARQGARKPPAGH
jgi:signal peptidase I